MASRRRRAEALVTEGSLADDRNLELGPGPRSRGRFD